MKKNILVTGAGKGIGNKILFDCLENFDFVYAIIRSKKDFQNLNKKVNKDKCKLYLGDISNIKLIEKVLLDSKKINKNINGIVNNAGERLRENFLKINKIQINDIFKNNFFNHFYLMQKVIADLKKNSTKKPISIVNIGSIVGVKGFNQLSGYASAKSALEGLTKSLAVEFASDQIRFNIVHPGFIKTSYYENFKKKQKKLYKWTVQKTPLGKWGESEDISELVMFLLSDKSKYITGQSICVDGGWTAS